MSCGYVCKTVVFGSSMSILSSNAVISVLLKDIWVVWLDVSSSNSVNADCNPSVLEILNSLSFSISCLLSIKVDIFPIGRVKLVWISKLPFIKRLLLIVPPVFCKQRISNSSMFIF